MARRSNTRTTEKRSSTSQPSKDTDSLSIIMVRRNPRTLGTSRFRLADERNTKPEKGRSKKHDPRRRWKSGEWQLLRPQGFDARDLKAWVTVALVTVLTGAWSTWSAREICSAHCVVKRSDSYLARYWGIRCIELRGIKINFIFLHSIPHLKALWIINRFVKVGLSETNFFIKRIVYYAICISQNDERILIDYVISITISSTSLIVVWNQMQEYSSIAIKHTQMVLTKVYRNAFVDLFPK